MLPTVKDVRGNIKIFNADSFEDDVINSCIEESSLKIKNDDIKEDMQKFAIITWCRHLLYIDSFMNYGGVTSASTFGNSQTISDMHNDDPYLQKYNQIAKDFGNAEEFGQVWTE